jgi:hypothetical protein
MAKKRAVSSSNVNNSVIVVLIIGLVAGFIGGYFIARERYTEKIAQISKMNMERAVEIDNLQRHIEILGASTDSEE